MLKMILIILLFPLPVCFNAAPIQAAPAIEWEKTFGGDFSDYGYAVQQTLDGGYIIVGGTASSDLLIDNDIYVLKTNSKGTLQWEKTFGGTGVDVGYSVQQATDGGYIITGVYAATYGVEDIYLIKTDAAGMLEWERTFGNIDSDEIGFEVQQTTDGGYIIVGSTNAFGAGSYDVYLIKTDSEGIMEWQKTFGGSEWDEGRTVQQTMDQGYIITGHRATYGAGNPGILIKTDAAGTLAWEKNFGGDGYSVKQTADQGYIITGSKLPPNAVYADVYLLKTDSEGNMAFERTFGGNYLERGYSVQQTRDQGYIIAGMSTSFGAGYEDMYLIKTNAEGILEWEKTIGGSLPDNGYSVQETTDYGYIITGNTYSSGEGSGQVYLVKLMAPDSDEDGITNILDNCPETPNPLQEDTYPPLGNGIGDACDCEGNFNCFLDQDVDGSDAATLKSHFGRSTFQRPCIAEDPCSGDFNCDGDVDGTDASLFKQDFGRSSMQTPCPAYVAGGEWCVYP